MDRKFLLEKSENIENLKIDKQKNKTIIDFAGDVAGSSAFDPEVLSYAELDLKDFTHICLMNLADIHFFDEGMDKKRFDKASEFLNKTSNAYAVLSGDTFTMSTLDGASNAHMSKLNNMNSAILGKQCLSKIKDKILFGVGGNHDGEQGSRNRNANLSLTRLVLDCLGITYFQYNVLLKINVDKEPYYVFVTHGSGKATTKAAALDNMYNKCEAIFRRFKIFPNLVLSGHFHADVNGRYVIEVPVYDNGRLVSTRLQELIIESAPALQGDSEFTTAYSMDVTKPNVNLFDISFAKNPSYNARTKNTESPIMWNVSKFPLLKNTKDEFSTPAQKYMEEYNEPNVKLEIENLVKWNKYDIKVDDLANKIKTLYNEEVKTI